MSRSPSPSPVTYQYGSNNCSPYRPLPEHDMLSKLKVQVFELDQNKRNYQCLMAKYKQLECELAKVADLKTVMKSLYNNLIQTKGTKTLQI